MERALFHDVRGVLGAAASNIEFLRARSTTPDEAPVLDEVAHELRLVSDVIALIGSTDERVVELDLRALVFFARGDRRFAVNPTEPPFVVCASRAALIAFANDVVAGSSRGATVHVSGGVCALRGLEADACERLRSAAVLADASLAATVEGDALILRRATEQELPGTRSG